MNILPSMNFARYLLTLFILSCLVIRTAYQGKQFEFLQKEMRPADVEAIDEMILRNFTFYFLMDYKLVYDEMDFVKR